MKCFHTMAIAAGLLAPVMLHAQNAFQNLDFESAVISPNGVMPYGVDFSQAFPSWTGNCGGVQQATAAYDAAPLDASVISIIDSGFSASGLPQQAQGGVIEGNYSALLCAGGFPVYGGTTGPAYDTTLSQTGLVPAGSRSLQVMARGDYGSLAVTMNGQTLTLSPLGTGLFGADIQGWAGQSVTLAFALASENPHVNNRYLYLDSVSFSSQPVPEPSTLGLLSLGGLLFGWRGRKSSCI